jgi:hypothetical protein
MDVGLILFVSFLIMDVRELREKLIEELFFAFSSMSWCSSENGQTHI